MLLEAKGIEKIEPFCLVAIQVLSSYAEQNYLYRSTKMYKYGIHSVGMYHTISTKLHHWYVKRSYVSVNS